MRVGYLSVPDTRRVLRAAKAVEDAGLKLRVSPVQAMGIPQVGPAFRNDSGEEMPAWGVGCVTGVELVDNLPRLVVDKPANADGNQWIFNIGEPVADGAVGVSQAGLYGGADYFIATYDTLPDDYQFKGTKVNTWDLAGGGADFVVIGQLSASDQTMLVKRNHQTRVRGKADSNITAGGSGTVSVWYDTADSGYNITAHLDWMDGGDDISSGKELVCDFFSRDRKWYITGAECE